MDSEYPVATIVILIILLASFFSILILYKDLLFDLNILKEQTLQQRVNLESKQVATNALTNLATAYSSCIEEENCLCDVYRLKFPTSYTVAIENDRNSIILKLLNKKGKTLISKSIKNINTGILDAKTDKSCSALKPFYLNTDDRAWYLRKEVKRHYFFNTINELYKVDSKTACFITEPLSLKPGESRDSIESYFNRLPRCSFKKKKKEEKAIRTFKTFVNEFHSCKNSFEKNSACICDFSKVRIPEGYVIKVGKLEDTLTFSLVREKTFASNETELLRMNEKVIDLLTERPYALDLQSLEPQHLCIKTERDLTAFYNSCDDENALLFTKETLAYFFSNGKKVGFLNTDSGILRYVTSEGEMIVNKGEEPLCQIPRKDVYTLTWPSDKYEGYYYVGECFGTFNASCNKGIRVLQKPGAPVYAVESGIVESIGEKNIVIIHRNGLKSSYDDVLLNPNLAPRKQVHKGQKIGEVFPMSKPGLTISIVDNKVDLTSFKRDQLCSKDAPSENSLIVKEDEFYSNPICYFSKDIRDEIIFPNRCSNPRAGCNLYGNEDEVREDVNLKILAIPINWERQYSYLLFSNDALERFIRATPLVECPSKLKKIFVDGKTDYGGSWKDGSCQVPGKNNCYDNALDYIKQCAEEYKAKTGQDYDFVVGVDDSNIARYPECDFQDRGWTLKGNDVVIVEAKYPSDVVHELGHKFNLRDQYCDCSQLAEADSFCGFDALPNPLKKELGCDKDGVCCFVISEETSPYLEGCMWCKGNFDIKSKDLDGDKVLDKGKRTIMSNFADSESYSIDEYLYLKTQSKLQCV